MFTAWPMVLSIKRLKVLQEHLKSLLSKPKKLYNVVDK